MSQPRSISLLSIVIPARDEEGSIRKTVERLHAQLCQDGVPNEIIVVDDGSRDRTWETLTDLKQTVPQLVAIKNEADHGFGRAVIRGLDAMKGDAVVVMMGDESDEPRHVTHYWKELNNGWDCVFGSRFIVGGGLVNYPKFKLLLNRVGNSLVRILFAISLNDTTNGFKAYRREVIDGCRPLVAAHFNLTVELPLKAIVRGYSWKTIPVTYASRRAGASKWHFPEEAGRYLWSSLRVWIEQRFSRAPCTKQSG